MIAAVLLVGLIVGCLAGASAVNIRRWVDDQIAADTHDTLVIGEADDALDDDTQAAKI